MKIIYHGVGLYKMGTKLGPVVFPHRDLIAVLEGQVEFSSGKNKSLVGAGDAWAIPARHFFEGRVVTDRVMIWVLHYKNYHSSRRQNPLASSKRPFCIRNACDSPFSRMILTEITTKWKTRPSCQRTLILLKLTELLLLGFEEALKRPLIKKTNRWKADIAATLNDEIGLKVRDLTKRSGISASYFRQEFRRAYESSPRDYMQRKRMEKARQLLSETSDPIKRIGQSLGYSAVSAFHRAFLREEGVTPAAYRATVSRAM